MLKVVPTWFGLLYDTILSAYEFKLVDFIESLSP